MLRRHLWTDPKPEHRNAHEGTRLRSLPFSSQFSVKDRRGQQVTIWAVTDKSESGSKTLLMLPHESPYRASDLEEVPGPLFVKPFP